MTKYFFLFLSLLVSIQVLAQKNADFITSPASYSDLQLDCATDDCWLFFKNQQSFTALENLEIKNFEGKRIPVSFFTNSSIKSLMLSNCPNVSYYLFFEGLEKMPNIESLALDNTDPNKAITKAGKSDKVTELSLNKMKGSTLWLDELSKLKKLKALSIADNNLAIVPESIKKLTQLTHLSLKNNSLSDLPSWISELDKLETFEIGGNLFEDPVKQLHKITSTHLKKSDITTASLSEEQKKELKHKFTALEFTTDTVAVSQSSLPVEKDEKATESADKKEALNYGVLNQKVLEVEIFSEAYLHYKNIFDQGRYTNTFDSLLFEERYQDSTYAGVLKMTDPVLISNRAKRRYNKTNPYDNIELKLTKNSEKGEVWFDFVKVKKRWIRRDDSKRSSYLGRFNNEVYAFSGMEWVFNGGLSKKEFKEKYCKPLYTDVRIFYDDAADLFTLELKKRQGKETIQAYPRVRNKKMALKESQKTYQSRYLRYVKALDTRKKRFHKGVVRNKAKYQKALEKSRAIAWDAFQKQYMTSEEVSLTKEQWLKYYDKVVANEKRALYSAPLTVSFMRRSLEISGDKRDMSYWSENMSNYKVVFEDQKGNVLPITDVLVISPLDNGTRTSKGALGIGSQYIMLDSTEYPHIMVQLRNGDAGYISSEKLESLISERESYELVIPVKVIPRMIGRVGVLRDLLKI